MIRPKRHLCIATGQNLANLIPSIQLQASEVLILETPAMKEAAANLKRALDARGIAVKKIPFDDSSPDAITESAGNIAMEYGVEPLVFNATGGHKLMTLALAENLSGLADDLHLVYAETRHDRIDWLKPDPSVEPMQDVLKIDDIFRAQGYLRVSDGNRDDFWQANASSRAALTRKMGDEAERFGRFFGTLNRLADFALNEDGREFVAHQELDYAPSGQNAELLKEAIKADLLRWDGEVDIVFKDRDSASYFRGGWLEEYVWFKLRGINPTDWASNLVTKSHRTNVENEFDAVVAQRNRLLIVECKTSGFGKNQVRDAGIVYKLAQIANQVGGAMGSKLLLSARPVNPEVMQRAKDYGVDILAAEDVRKFVQYIKRWMSGEERAI